MEGIKKIYNTTVRDKMIEKFHYLNSMAVPTIEKVTINTSFGRLISGKGTDETRKTVDGVSTDLAAICGQKPAIARAKKSIAGFRLREGQPIGLKVTLRNPRMYQFLDKLVGVVLARSRDFRGVPLRAIDQRGNLTIGMKEHIIFPEISPERVRYPFGLEITITTTAKTKEEGVALFRLLGFPLEHEITP